MWTANVRSVHSPSSAAALAVALLSLASRVEAATCDGTGILEPPLRADEQLIVAMSPASGYERTTLYQVPDSAPPSDRKLVILLHGGGETNREDQLSDMRATGWMQIAESDGVVIAYPTAMQDPDDPDSRLNWNDGRLGTDIWAMPDHANIDDAGYISEVMDYAQQNLGVGGRIYVLGISNGGMMSLRLTTDPRTQHRIQRMVTMVAQIPTDRWTQPIGAVPLMMIAGTADPLMPFTGGDILIQAESEDGTPLGDPTYASSVVSFNQTLKRFINVNGCAPTPTTRNFPDVDHDGIRVREMDYCLPSRTVRAYLVVNGGHRWPGVGDNSPDWTRACYVTDSGFHYYVTAGPTTLDGFRATNVAWQYFSAP